MKTVKYIIIFIFASGIISAQKQYSRIALLNGIAHVGNGEVIEGSLIVIEKDRIQSVASTVKIKLNYNAFDTVIDISGKHVYPALINTNNILGLHDAEAVRATVDFAEVGHLNPHIRALIAYNTDNIILPTVKTNGILYTQVTPRGGLISGSSSVMALEGWNWEDAVLLADDGIHVNFPKQVNRKWSGEEDSHVTNANKFYSSEMLLLQRFFADAKAYCAGTVPAEKNIRFEAMRAVFNGKANLYLHADHAKDILTALNFAAENKIKKAVIVGGRECYKVSARLKQQGVAVMLNRLHDLPGRPDEDVDLLYRIPAMLLKDSVLFCLQLEGDMEAMQSRNLPFNAGAAVAYGLTPEQALAAISLNAARILGLDKELGTIEPGKLASLVVSEGDILDMRSNNITLAYLAGKRVDLMNGQTRLYEKYKVKYGIK